MMASSGMMGDQMRRLFHLVPFRGVNCSDIASIAVDNLTSVELMWLRRGGIALMILGIMASLCSWWLRTQHLQRLRLHGPTRKLADCEPNVWDKVGVMLCLKEPQGGSSRSLEGASTDLAGQSLAPSSSVLSVSEEKPLSGPGGSTKKKGHHLLSWNGVKALGLES